MDQMRKCIPGARQAGIAAALLICFFLSRPVFAQSPSLAERLSPDTILYVEWRGASFLTQADHQNHLLQLLEDPQMGPAWAALAGQLQKGLAKQTTTVPSPGLFDFISLAANPALFGVTEIPDVPKTSAGGNAQPRLGIFLVYDPKGKLEVIQKFREYQKATSKTAVAVTHFDFQGTQVEVETTGTDASYSAEAGNYFVLANQRHAVEDLITRFHGDAKPASSVTELPEYKEVKKYIGQDSSIELFARVPNFHKLLSADTKNQAILKALENLHLDKIHAAGGGLSVAGEATRFHGAVLGDTSSGSPFDFYGASTATFATLPVVGNSATFSISRLDWAALYRLIRSAAEGALTPAQAAGVGAVEGAAQGYLGMSISDALGLFSGEIASASSYDADGTAQQMFAVAIQKPNDLLRMLRAVVGTMIAGEDTSGDTTYLDLAYPYKDPGSSTQRRKLYYIAVTPHMLVAGERKKNVRDAITRLEASGDAAAPGGLFASEEYGHLRSQLPDKLSGLSAGDFRQIPVDKIVQKYLTQAAEGGTGSKDYTPPDLTWIQLIKPEVISRHVHLSVGGTWKDANGVYFDLYLQ